MSEDLHYTYRVEWSPEDNEWVGLVAEFPSLSHLDADPVEAMRGIRDLVEGVVADMLEEGATPPAPFADRRYSGKVFVRTSPELHRRLTIEAAEQGVSVNQWAMQKLAERATVFNATYSEAIRQGVERFEDQLSALFAGQEWWRSGLGHHLLDQTGGSLVAPVVGVGLWASAVQSSCGIAAPEDEPRRANAEWEAEQPA